MLTATEFHMREPLPLASVHEAIFEFCRDRTDAVVFGAQAVNFHVPVPRMSQDVDLLSPEPERLARELAAARHARFHVAVRVREIHAAKAYRVYQQRSEGPRHLANVRLAEFGLDDAIVHDGVRYVSLAIMIAMKVCALVKRRLAPKGATDLADLRRLLLSHPDLRTADAPVLHALSRVGGGEDALHAWRELVNEPAVADEDLDEGY